MEKYGIIKPNLSSKIGKDDLDHFLEIYNTIDLGSLYYFLGHGTKFRLHRHIHSVNAGTHFKCASLLGGCT